MFYIRDLKENYISLGGSKEVDAKEVDECWSSDDSVRVQKLFNFF